MVAKRKISLVLADVDGTLVNEDKILTERAQGASGSCGKPASGLRSPVAGRRSAWPCCSTPALDTPIAGFNGGLLSNGTSRSWSKRRSPPMWRARRSTSFASMVLDAWSTAA